jgi:hypothetical protein
MGTPSSGGWRPCPEGELGRLATRLAAGRRRQRLVWGVALGAAVAAATGLTAAAVADRLPGWGFGSSHPAGGCGGTPAPVTAPSCPTTTP